jgi:pimeloyl-ACP methyl ester carboxylesterase
MKPLMIQLGDMTFSGHESGPPDGDPVLLLHGFPETSRAWRNQLDALASARFHAVAPDLRGYSDDARPADPGEYGLDALASDLLGIADAVGAQTFHLVGHDVGGIVAWYIAGRHADRLRTLTVASTPHLVPFAAALLDGQTERLPPFPLFRQPPGVPEAALLADGAAALRRGYAGLEPAVAEEYVDWFSKPGVLTAVLNYFRCFDYTQWAVVPPSPVPTMFLWGRDDPYLAPEAADATRAYATGPYRAEPLDGVAHWVAELAPDTVNRLLLEHLTS